MARQTGFGLEDNCGTSVRQMRRPRSPYAAASANARQGFGQGNLDGFRFSQRSTSEACCPPGEDFGPDQVDSC